MAFLCDFDWKINLLYYFVDSRSFSISKGQFEDQNVKM